MCQVRVGVRIKAKKPMSGEDPMVRGRDFTTLKPKPMIKTIGIDPYNKNDPTTDKFKPAASLLFLGDLDNFDIASTCTCTNLQHLCTLVN